MSFSQLKEIIEEGDTVILYLNPLNLHSIEVKPEIPNKHDELVDNVFQTKYGALKIKGLIGQKFGSKVSLSKGWAYVLHPTPELWTLTLPHRTQIIYSADISMIIFQLDLKPGCIVIESGTGSGSLTHALARTVSPNGTVHTFDFHKQRAAIAEAEFAGHKIDSVVKSYHRDVCQLGFGPDLDSLADAVFLDLPLPWTVVPHAVKVIKKSGGRFCSFSPCIEQVKRTCEALHESGFREIQTMECLQRELTVRSRTVPILHPDKEEESEEKMTFTSALPQPTVPGHTGYLTFATLPPN